MFTLTAFTLLACAAAVSAQQPTSVYTSISGNKCKTTSVNRESGGATMSCPGTAGYRLEVQDDDNRMNIVIIAPNGKRHDLDLWNVVSSAFSSLGEEAEWRMSSRNGKLVPTAFIVRFSANDKPDDPEKKTSYLVVAKITPGKICVTRKIGPSRMQNVEARRAADASADKPCMESASR